MCIIGSTSKQIMIGPFVIVIFGATGDLAQHKLIPALFSLYKNKQLSDKFHIVGFARRPFSDEEYSHMLGDELEFHNDPAWKDFAKNIYYQQGLFDERAGYEQLIEKLNTFDQKIGACITRLFYLATPPDNYETILTNLHETKLSEGCGQGSSKWTRVVIEKPFGKDLETARNLDKTLAKMFEEKQIFRVDHYLGKETVQNMLAFRFANSVFEPVWNNQHLDHVQITWAEKEGIGKRGKFFDGVGMLRDVMQNHLLQMMATVTMEQPKSFEKEAIRDTRANAIKAIQRLTPQESAQSVVRGQYTGYKEEKDVSHDSATETFVAMKLFVDTPRFSGIPFYVRAGKKMPKEVMEISLVFVQKCHILFKEYGCPEIGNVLTIRIQPDEGISLRMIAKKPDNKLSLETVDMSFSYHQAFGGHGADAYEKVLLDILTGDQMLFNRSDELESSWQLISNILEGLEKETAPLPTYAPNTWGPQEALDLIEKDGRTWL